MANFTIQNMAESYTDQVIKAFPAIARSTTAEAQAVYDYLAITDVPHICEDTLKQKIDAMLTAENKQLSDYYPEGAI